MARKVAIFVEGLTEQVFVLALVRALLGNREIHYGISEQFKGKVVVSSDPIPANAEFYILIVNCHGDEQVLTQIRDQYAVLLKGGYSAVLGLRDVFPIPRAKIGVLRASITASLPKGTLPASLHLAVMEVEAWFLGETKHFLEISPALTVDLLLKSGFDVKAALPQDWDRPAETLHAIYRLAGVSYLLKGQKKKRRIERTVRALSFEDMYVGVRHSAPDLDAFLGSMETALF